MCGLFGFSSYGIKTTNELFELTKSLSEYSAQRGTDATGIAFCHGKGINITKAASPGYKFDFKFQGIVPALIGHTRHSTHGSEKYNSNNHPFPGKVSRLKFALAHNGVLTNHEKLRKELSLPNTKIETDSYIAVQLIENKNELSFDSLKFMAETVEGSFSFSLLDNKNNIYLVKGDSPLSILHFPKSKIYVYASTDEILYRAIIDSSLFDELKNKDYEEIDIMAGDILKITPFGIIEKSHFNYKNYYSKGWWEYGFSPLSLWDENGNIESGYISDLKAVAEYMGYSPDIIDSMLAEGFTPEEIEDYIYEI